MSGTRLRLWRRLRYWGRRAADVFPMTGLGLATAAVAALVIYAFVIAILLTLKVPG